MSCIFLDHSYPWNVLKKCEVFTIIILLLRIPEFWVLTSCDLWVLIVCFCFIEELFLLSHVCTCARVCTHTCFFSSSQNVKRPLWHHHKLFLYYLILWISWYFLNQVLFFYVQILAVGFWTFNNPRFPISLDLEITPQLTASTTASQLQFALGVVQRAVLYVWISFSSSCCISVQIFS